MDLRKKKLQEKGITLIALVVTIIILLILAGVTITAVMSDNGLFKKARMAAEIHTIAVEKEQINMCYNSVKIGKLSTEAQGGAGNSNTQPTKQKTSVYFKLFRNSSDEIIGFYSNSDSTSYPNSTLVADFGSRGDDGSYSKTVNDSVYRLDVKKVVINDEIVPGNLSYFFSMLHGKDESTIENLSNLNTSQATDFSGMFAGMAIKNIDFSSWNVEKAQSFDSMFIGCSNLKEVVMDNLDLSKVTNFSDLFNNCSKLEKISLKNTRLNSVTSLTSTFSGLSSIKEIDFSNANLENVSNFSRAFEDLSTLTKP